MKKRVEDLKPGDIAIYARPSSFPDTVRFCVLGDSSIARRVGMRTLVIAEIGDGSRNVSIEDITAALHDEVEVESRELTPAQQHAEELLAYVRQCAGGGNDADLLLDKIEPPQAPTLEEALFALELLYNGDVPGLSGQRANAAKVLAQARRAGVFK